MVIMLTRDKQQCSSILNVPHKLPVCMLSLVKSNHTWGQDSSVVCHGSLIIHVRHLLYISLNTFSNLYLTPTDGELLRVSDHELCVFIMTTQEPMNSAAPWRSYLFCPAIPKRHVCGNSYLLWKY